MSSTIKETKFNKIKTSMDIFKRHVSPHLRKTFSDFINQQTPMPEEKWGCTRKSGIPVLLEKYRLINSQINGLVSI